MKEELISERIRIEAEKRGFPAYKKNPTQSFLLKWLRDKHKIYLQPTLVAQLQPWEGWGYELTYKDSEIVSGKGDLGCNISYAETGWCNTDEDFAYKTYEEALEKGLLNALNLIPYKPIRKRIQRQKSTDMVKNAVNVNKL